MGATASGKVIRKVVLPAGHRRDSHRREFLAVSRGAGGGCAGDVFTGRGVFPAALAVEVEGSVHGTRVITCT